MHSKEGSYRPASRISNYQRTCTDCTKAGSLGLSRLVYISNNNTHEAALLGVCTLSPCVLPFNPLIQRILIVQHISTHKRINRESEGGGGLDGVRDLGQK